MRANQITMLFLDFQEKQEIQAELLGGIPRPAHFEGGTGQMPVT